MDVFKVYYEIELSPDQKLNKIEDMGNPIIEVKDSSLVMGSLG